MSPVLKTAVVSAVLLQALSVSAADGRREKAAKAATAAAEQVLRSESAQSVDRRTRLSDLIEQSPETPALRWQAGYIWNGQEWRPFEAVPASTSDGGVYEQYQTLRDAARLTSERHLELANWCRQHQLPQQERVHLLALLAATAEPAQQAPILQRLGYASVFGQWLSPREIADWRRIIDDSQASLQSFGPKLQKISAQLASDNQNRPATTKGLAEIATPAAIPAVELLWMGRDESTALLGIQILRRISGHEAAIALARQAVFSPWEAVRSSATEDLLTREFADFVPLVIGMLSTPAEARFSITQESQRGILFYSCVFARETENQFQVARLNTISYAIDDLMDAQRFLSGNSTVPQQRQGQQLLAARAQHDGLRGVGDELYLREQQVERWNEKSAEINRRVSHILARVSGHSNATDPQVWWQWWADYNEMPRPSRRVVIVDELDVIGNPAPPPPIVTVGSCFGAGTPVWTNRGLVAIEEIRLGDLVLTQDVETAELGYRPALQTTRREPVETLKLTIGGETLTASKGHRFWVSGSGWFMIKDLAEQALLHTATGSLPVESIVASPAEPVYNLVVADTNNYFVGRMAILSHDVTIPRPTNRVVPGLVGK